MSTHAENVHLMNENSDLRRILARLLKERAMYGQPKPETWADVAARLDAMGIDVYGNSE